MFDQPYAQVARWAGATAITTILCASAAQAQPVREADYALPAQALAHSLREVSVRSGTSVIAPSELVAGRQAPPLRGRFGARQAVEALLQGTGLRVRIVGDALVVTRAGATAEGEIASPAEQVPESEPIIVTGTNIRGGQPTSPVIVLGRDDIADSGATSVEQLMRKVPQNNQSGINQENFLVVGAGADPTEHGAGLNLRGLGQRATLVLVDGRRLAPSGAGSFVDVSLIPLSAVERVEILTDGASAIYGSDAVGGVVNFIMRRDFEGIETVLQAGSATRGDGDELLAGITGGTNWGTGRAMLSYEYRHEDEIRARDRDYTINLAPDTTIFPRERRHSLFALFNQELAEGLELDLSGSFSRRDTQRTHFSTGNPLPIGADAEAQSMSITGSLTYRFGGDWVGRFNAGYSRSATEQMQTQPGGEELVNRFDSRNTIVDFGAQADGSLFQLPGGDVKLALGLGTRRETYLDVFETQVNPARERRADRQVRSLFGELRVPLFSELNRLPGLERLTLTAALRYEHYDGLGGSVDPKLGLLWSPLPGLSFRMSYGTSFRAPLLSESVGLYNALLLPPVLLTVAGQPPSGIAMALLGSNPDIQPERSTSWTAGFDFEPRFAPGLSVRANYYAIHFSVRIALPAPTLAVIGNPAFEPILTRSPDIERVRALLAGAGQIVDFSGPGFTPGGAEAEDVTIIVDNRFGNTSVTRTDGLDIGIAYVFEIGLNRFSADLNASYILFIRRSADSGRPNDQCAQPALSPRRPARTCRPELGSARLGRERLRQLCRWLSGRPPQRRPPRRFLHDGRPGPVLFVRGREEFKAADPRRLPGSEPLRRGSAAPPARSGFDFRAGLRPGERDRPGADGLFPPPRRLVSDRERSIGGRLERCRPRSRAAVAAVAALVATGSAEAAREAPPSVSEVIEVVQISSLSASPDGGAVAFRTEQARLDLNMHILSWHVADLRQATIVRVGGGGAPIYGEPGVIPAETAVWSRDGAAIFYRSMNGGAIGICRASADGGGDALVFRDEADVESFRPEAGGAVLTLGPPRDAILDAERREYEDGILVDESVPLNQNLVRSGFVNGRLATQRLSGPWFARVGLLAGSPRRQRMLDLSTLEVSVSTSAPPPAAAPELGVDPGISVQSSTGAVARISRNGGETVVELRPSAGGRPVRCGAAVCRDERIAALAWRPGTGQLLLTVQDVHRGHSLYLWDTASGDVRLVVRSEGLLSGGPDGQTPCAITGEAAICVASSAVSPPRLERIDLETGVRAPLFDPNAALREAGMPTVERLTWTSVEGQSFSAILLLPRHRAPGRLPLLVNYYQCGGFLSGGVGDELPFLPLAGSGMAVACINAAPIGNLEDFRRRYDRGLVAVRSLVDLLDERGLVDRRRVGMAGLSFGSESTMWTLVHSRLLAAAAIASSQIEPAYYWFNAVRGRTQPEVLRRFWGLGSPDESPEAWRRHSAAMNVERITAPLLLQLPEQEARSVIELYARLTRSRTPAEMHVFPDTAHLKIQPRHRRAAHQRYHDWFRYWLQGHSDPDPARAGQYRRWDLLRRRWREGASSPGAQP